MTVPLLLTVKEVSQLLRIHRPKVYDLIRDGMIEGFKVGSDWRVKKESVEKIVGPIPPEFFESKKKGKKTLSAVNTDEKIRAVQS